MLAPGDEATGRLQAVGRNLDQRWTATSEPGASRRPRDLPLFVLPGAILLLLIGLPLVALVARTVAVGSIAAHLASPVVADALRLSALTSGITLFITLLGGTPLAFVLARRRFPGKRLVETLIDLPLVLPPVVAGVALLMAFGRRGLVGGELAALGVTLPFTTAAVVLAQTFVSAPFFVRGAKVGFAAVSPEVEEAAAIDGGSRWRVFRDVTLPLAWPGVAAGAVLCWARALSEFGATLMFAGSMQGRTQTMPLAILASFERDLGAALALSLLLLVFSSLVLLAFRALTPSGDAT